MYSFVHGTGRKPCLGGLGESDVGVSHKQVNRWENMKRFFFFFFVRCGKIMKPVSSHETKLKFSITPTKKERKANNLSGVACLTVNFGLLTTNT